MRTETAQAGVSLQGCAARGLTPLWSTFATARQDYLLSQSPSLCQQIEGLLGIPAWFPIKSRYSLSDTSLFRCQRIAGSSRFPGTKQQQAPQLHTLVRLFSPYSKAKCPPSRAVLSFLCLDRFYRSTSCFCTSTRLSNYSIISNDINIPDRGKYKEWNSDHPLSFSFPGIKMHALYFVSSLFSGEWAISTCNHKEVHRSCDYWSHNPASLLPFLFFFFLFLCLFGTAGCLEEHAAWSTQKCALGSKIPTPQKAQGNVKRATSWGFLESFWIRVPVASSGATPAGVQTQAVCYMGSS